MKPETTNKIARLISTIFIPPFFTILVFAYFALTLESELTKKLVTFLIPLIFGFISPILLFLILRAKGKIIDVDASVKEERTLPFFIVIIFYLTGLGFLVLFHVNIVSIAFWFCYISNTLITIIINKYWKISAHSMGAAGPFAASVLTFGLLGLVLLPVTILVGWSRFKLKCHSFAQVLAGILLAFFSTYIQMNLIIRYLNR